MAALRLNFQVDSSAIFPNLPSLTVLASLAMLTYSGPRRRIASWLAFSDHLYSQSVQVIRPMDRGDFRSSDQVVESQVRFDLLAQFTQHFLLTNIASLLDDKLSLFLNPDSDEVVDGRIELTGSATFNPSANCGRKQGRGSDIPCRKRISYVEGISRKLARSALALFRMLAAISLRWLCSATPLDVKSGTVADKIAQISAPHRPVSW